MKLTKEAKHQATLALNRIKRNREAAAKNVQAISKPSDKKPNGNTPSTRRRAA